MLRALSCSHVTHFCTEASKMSDTNDTANLITGSSTNENLRKRNPKNRAVLPPKPDKPISQMSREELATKFGVYLARPPVKRPWWQKYVEIGGVLLVLGLMIGCIIYIEEVHFHVARAYAHLGSTEAAHIVGQRYMQGQGVDQHMENAMKWFKVAADQGHANSAYNLAVGHLQGHKTELKRGDPKQYVQMAADQGHVDAGRMMRTLCANNQCEDFEP